MEAMAAHLPLLHTEWVKFLASLPFSSFSPWGKKSNELSQPVHYQKVIRLLIFDQLHFASDQ